MECEKHFDKFDENISLDVTRQGRIGSAMSALETFVSNDEEENQQDRSGIKDVLIEMFLQGSYAIGTCIKPANDKDEFDVDIVLSLELRKSRNGLPEDNPRQVLKWLENRLKQSDNYKERIKDPKPRCVRIRYAGDFHLDIVPVVPMTHKDGILWIPDKTEGWDTTNPKGFTRWCEGKKIESGERFKRVVKYLKWWRSAMVPDRAKISSILLTTLTGNHIIEGNTDAETLVGTMESLNLWLQLCTSVPEVEKPLLPEEDLARDWSEPEFLSFKKHFNEATMNSRDAIDEPDLTESIKLWQEVFGDKFPISIDEGDGEEGGKRYVLPLSSGKKYPREFA